MPASAELHASAAGRLAEREQRYTANRQAIVEVLAAQPAPVTLPDLLRARRGLSQSSTYRNLAALEDAGVVRRLVAGGEHAHYELAEDLTGHHHHLVCASCGAIEDVELAADLERELEAAFDALARARGFVPEAHTIDIHGRCASCPR
jgi:Fe2+ or Zn2+ uptake regulation protein